ncbi:MAG: hypothetical protein AB8G95_00615 [Anaerolineae bacterium]
MNSQQDNFKVSIVVILCAYFLFGNVMLDSQFSWSPNFGLASFGKTTTEVSRYELKFTQIYGEALAEPIYFADMDSMLASDDIYDGKRLVNQLGHAIFTNDISAASRLSSKLEREYLWPLGKAEFEVVFIDTDPVEKYSTNSFISERVLSTYQIPLGEPIASRTR